MKVASRSVVQIDWLLFYLRWLLVGAVALQILLDPGTGPVSPTPAVVVFIAAAAAYNVLVATLLGIGWWRTIFPALEVVLDSLLAVAAFQVSGWSFNVMLWAALFPSITAALRLGLMPAVATALAIMVANAGMAFIVQPRLFENYVAFITNTAFLLVGTVLSGAVSQRVRLEAIKRTHAERDAEEKRLTHIREQARAIYDMASLVSATLNYERVLDAALDRSAAVMADTGSAASQMVSAVMLFRDGALRVATARRFTPSDLKVSLPGQAGVLAEAINNGDPAYSTQPYNDPELSQIIAFRNCRVLMAAPLQAGLDTYGVMLFAHPRPDFFDLDHLELLEAVCQHMIIAVQNARLYQRLLQEKERIVEVEEEARKKLARDLHDGPTQSVAAVAMRANYIRRLLERDPKGASEELYRVEELARRTAKEIRHMLFTLRPLVLESQGLVAALQSLADKMRDSYNANVIVEAQPDTAESLDLHSQGVLFYIVEEAVGNARKHAQSAHIWVRLKQRTPDIVAVEIRDDGVGFDVSAVSSSYDQRGSLGLVNMRERTELVGGVLNIESALGKGTKITVLVPLNEEAREKLLG